MECSGPSPGRTLAREHGRTGGSWSGRTKTLGRVAVIPEDQVCRRVRLDRARCGRRRHRGASQLAAASRARWSRSPLGSGQHVRSRAREHRFPAPYGSRWSRLSGLSLRGPSQGVVLSPRRRRLEVQVVWTLVALPDRSPSRHDGWGGAAMTATEDRFSITAGLDGAFVLVGELD